MTPSASDRRQGHAHPRPRGTEYDVNRRRSRKTSTTRSRTCSNMASIVTTSHVIRLTVNF